MAPDIDLHSMSFAGARFLPERTINAEPDEARLRAWQQEIRLDDRRFADRLAADGLDRHSFGRLLATPETASEPPAWVELLVEAVHAMAEPATAATQAQESFGTALDGFVAVAWRRLRARAGSIAADWGALAGQLQDDLRALLVRLARPTLVLELNVARLEDRLPGDTPEERYRHFVEVLLRTPSVWTTLFAEYQGLARLLAETTRRWVDVVSEVLTHLAADLPHLVGTLLPDGQPTLVELTGGISDPHRGGRGVWKLGFAPAGRVVYKPRSLAVDVGFQRLLEFCNGGQTGVPTLPVLRIVDRGDHGWVEHVERRDCRDADEVDRFYRRQGAYLALLHVVDGVDMHHENLIACGENPYLVDLETLFDRRLPGPPDGDDALSVAGARLRDSVLRTWLLPGRAWGDEENAGINIGGLGNGESQLTPYTTPSWTGQGTDRMHLDETRKTVEAGDNLPRLAGSVVPVARHTEALVAGFRTMLRFLAAQRHALLAEGGPIAAFGGVEVRQILRATSVYGHLLVVGRHPDRMRDLLDREQLLDLLWFVSKDDPALWRMIPVEKADLRLGDIPYFVARPDSRDLWDSRGDAVRDFFPDTAMAAVAARLRALDEAEIAAQVFVIRAALSASDSVGSRAQVGHPTPAADRAELALDAACGIGEQLLDTAILGRDDVTWLGMASIGTKEEFTVAPLGSDLYDGTAGVALFLAHLGDLSGDERFTRTAQRVATGLRTRLAEPPAGPLGGFLGVTSQLYALTQLAALWDDPALLPASGPLLDHVAATLPDGQCDLLYGAAGALLSLLALHAATGDERALAVATDCGRHLAKHAVPGAAGVAWPSHVSRRKLLGFSHGTAGIAYALTRLADATGAEEFATLAGDALRYERGHFDATAGNWPDFRDNSAGRFRLAWCHGAPGIALSRLAAVDPEARREVEIAVATTLAAPPGANDGLCHGELGNLMIVNRAASVLDRPDWQAQVARRLDAVLAATIIAGPRCAFDFPSSAPALMDGIAGIGYGLLHLTRPDRVPLLLDLAAKPAVSR